MPRIWQNAARDGRDVLIFEDAATACRGAAQAIEAVIREAVEARGKAVLGLATGRTPLPIYEHLVSSHEGGRLSFVNVSTYNLDEYYPIHASDPRSYHAYMHRYLFSRVDLPPNRTHVLDGTVPEPFVAEHAAAFDRWIAADGGLDLQLLGIGRNGHIGFNEPMDLSVDEAVRLPTRLVDLHPVTKSDAAKDFGGEDRVIPRALTMGVAPILAARTVLVLAFGSNKSDAVARALTGPKTAEVPASLLQAAPGKVTWLLDGPAASGLS